jgi:hypothetical protein
MEINSTSQRQRKFTSRSAMYVLATQEARCARVASCVREARCKGGDHGYLGALQHTAEAGCQLCSRLAADVDAPLAAEDVNPHHRVLYPLRPVWCTCKEPEMS